MGKTLIHADVKSGYLSRRQRRQYVLWLFLIGIFILLGVEGFRKENRELFRQLFEVPAAPVKDVDEVVDLSRTIPLPGLDRAALDTVKDRTVLRESEMPVLEKILRFLKDTPSDELRKKQAGKALLAQYAQQPGAFRGRLITLKGIARAAYVEKVFNKSLESQGVRYLYPVWITPEDCPTEPVVVYCLELPEGFPRGKDLEEKVRFEAVFFKLQPYASNEGSSCTAFFYAQSPRWNPHAPKITHPEKKSTFPLWTVVLAGLAFAAVILLFINSRIRAEQIVEELPEKMEVPEAPAPPKDSIEVFRSE